MVIGFFISLEKFLRFFNTKILIEINSLVSKSYSLDF